MTPPTTRGLSPKPPAVEYRVVWKRVGLPQKTKRYAQRWRAERFVVLLGPEPWKALGRDPGQPYCCSGYECGCRGVTWGEHLLNERTMVETTNGEDYKRTPYAAIEFVRIEERAVGEWSPAAVEARR